MRLSDGRELSGADAVLYWERTLHALESGVYPLSVLRVADSSGGITPMSTASDEAGYVGGGTMVHGNLDMSWVSGWTEGFLADMVDVEGTMEVFLLYTGPYPSQESKTMSVDYRESAYGDQVSTSASIYWDYRWQPQVSAAASTHSAHYGEFVARTTTSGSH